jgi:hypothetical protein
MADWIGKLKDLYTRDTRELTDEELHRILAGSDEDLMRMSGTMHQIPVVESMRRLRETIRDEASAVRWLTAALVFLTVVLVVLAAFDFWRHA